MTHTGNLTPGDILRGWCSLCHEQTAKRWQPGKTPPLKCTQCEEREEETK